MYLGVRLVVCLFIYLYIFVLFFVRGSHKMFA